MTEKAFTELPFFYLASIPADSGELVLPEETSKHVVSVLRMQEGDELQLTNGFGKIVKASIKTPHKKNCLLEIIETRQEQDIRRPVTLAISLLKNPSRFEWMLEKVTEMGVRSVIPLISQRTERQHFRADRMKNITISAMLQSQQSWLPELSDPVSFETFIAKEGYEHKFIAHCLPEERSSLRQESEHNAGTSVVLIGPEGDFTPKEIDEALKQGYKPVTLGSTRLRSETAGVVAATILVI